MAKYRLKISALAKDDLQELYRYGFLTWGERLADEYRDALLAHFDLLCENPLLFQAADDIREGYRRSVCKSHSVYYRVSKTEVEIMAVIKHQDFGG